MSAQVLATSAALASVPKVSSSHSQATRCSCRRECIASQFEAIGAVVLGSSPCVSDLPAGVHPRPEAVTDAADL